MHAQYTHSDPFVEAARYAQAPALAASDAELLALGREWEAQAERLRMAEEDTEAASYANNADESTYLALAAEEDRLNTEAHVIRNRIARIRATTDDGLMLKARVVAWCHRGDAAEFAEVVDDALRGRTCSDQDMALLLARDLVLKVTDGQRVAQREAA